MRNGFKTLVTLTCCGLVGCSSVMSSGFSAKMAALNPANMFSDDDEKSPKNTSEDRDEDPLVGSRVTISGMTTPLIEGVGLVTGLDGTGGDVPPSTYRRMILEDMKKRRVENPQKVLQSPSTAVVVVRAYLPPLAQKGDMLDVEVILPPGSEATSLRGGWLLPTRMHEQGFVAGRGQMKDDEAAIATGPILLSFGDEENLRNAGVVRQGTIPGGGKYIGDNRTVSLILRTDYRSARNAKRIADRVGMRFHGFDEYGVREPLAEAKTDARVELKVPQVYRDNIPRFLKVVRNVSVSESPIETRIRMERLREDILEPSKSENAALQLEAIGKDAIPTLREGLAAKELLCRFQAASALAYLGDDAGVGVLAEAADTSRALRVWSMLAMSCMSGGEAIPNLVELLNSESIETRYGAVRAISTVDTGHPAIRGIDLTERAVLRTVESDAAPVVHITKSQKSEITLFGSTQEFALPFVGRAGNKIMVVGKPGDRSIRVSRFSPGEEDQTVTVTPMIADVIRAAADMGATYPDLVSLVLEADKQGNLPGSLAIDALPKGGRTYIPGAFSSGIPDEDTVMDNDDEYEDPAGLLDFNEEDESDSLERTPRAGQSLAPAETSPLSAAPAAATEATVQAAAPVSPPQTAQPGYSAVLSTSGSRPAESAAPAADLPPAQGEPGLSR